AGDVETLPAVHGLQLKVIAPQARRLPLLVVAAVARPLNDFGAGDRAGARDIDALAAVDRHQIENVGPDALQRPLLVGVPAAGPLDDAGAVADAGAAHVGAFAGVDGLNRHRAGKVQRRLVSVVAPRWMRSTTRER